MAEQDVQDGADTIKRIGEACDRLGHLGYPEVAGAIARSTHQRRGLLRRKVYPAGIARELLDLAEQAEHLARTLGTPLVFGLDIGRGRGSAVVARPEAWYCRDCGAEFDESEIVHDTCPACGGKPRRCMDVAPLDHAAVRGVVPSHAGLGADPDREWGAGA